MNTQDKMMVHAKELLSSATNRLEEIYTLPVHRQEQELIQLGWDLCYVEGWVDGIENHIEDSK